MYKSCHYRKCKRLRDFMIHGNLKLMLIWQCQMESCKCFCIRDRLEEQKLMVWSLDITEIIKKIWIKSKNLCIFPQIK